MIPLVVALAPATLPLGLARLLRALQLQRPRKREHQVDTRPHGARTRRENWQRGAEGKLKLASAVRPGQNDGTYTSAPQDYEGDSATGKVARPRRW